MTDTTAPLPVPPPASPVAGWRTSEAWLTFLTALPALALNSGLVANAPLLAKIVSLAIAALTVLGYTANRTNLKKAHLAYATNALVVPANTNAGLLAKLPAAATGAAAAVLALLVALGCTQTAKVTAPAVAGGDAFLACEGVNLAQDVTLANGQTVALLTAVAGDLVTGNYAQAIADLIATLGGQVIGCAVLAVDTVEQAGKSPGSAARTLLEAHARELIFKYGWKAKPPIAPPITVKPATP